MAGPGLIMAQAEGIGTEILTRAGAAAAILALLGLALVIPLFVAQRREVRRLERWRELEPEQGEGEGAPALFRARPTGEHLTPHERVTADRPALERITAERAALESPSFWRRLLAGGPRHPAVLSVLALLVAAAAVFGVSRIVELDDETDGRGGGIDRAAVEVTVLNASAQTGLAGRVGDNLAAAGFTILATSASPEPSKVTVVQFDQGRRRQARVVARELGREVEVEPFDRRIRSLADGAGVVVVAGEDRA